ncbi:hypothetical protein NDU88_000476, partial [Pleurodeles waltl]
FNNCCLTISLYVSVVLADTASRALEVYPVPDPASLRLLSPSHKVPSQSPFPHLKEFP